MAQQTRTVLMNETGRLTLPADARHRLGLEGETEFEVEVDTDQDAVILRPAMLLRREDAWAYTPEHRKLLARAHQDSKKGRVRKMTESQLRDMAD
ncbi:MAG: AbrB/MazE/SpoVT family DNA-binding domain-containing protein [Actinomycetota bacterium]